MTRLGEARAEQSRAEQSRAEPGKAGADPKRFLRKR